MPDEFKSIYCPKCSKGKIQFAIFKNQAGEWVSTSHACKCKYVFPVIRTKERDKIWAITEKKKIQECRKYLLLKNTKRRK